MAALVNYTPDSNRIVHNTAVDFTARTTRFEPVHLVQYDNKLPIIAVTMYNNGIEYAVPNGASANIRWGKKQRKFVNAPALGCSTDRKKLYFEVSLQMVTQWGTFTPIVEVIVSGQVAGSSYITCLVDRNPIQQDDIEDTTEFKELSEYAKEAKDSASKAASSASSASSSASAASASQSAAAQSATEAAGSAQSASSSASSATDAANSASQSATTASSAANAAETAKTASQTAKDAAETAAENAKSSETKVEADKAEVESAKTAAETAAANAAKSETAAKSSETQAKNSADSASSSASSASSSKDAAAKSAEAAAASATKAAKSEENASTSETNAAKSAEDAEASAQRASQIAGGDFVTHYEVGKPGGPASLDEEGKVPLDQLPDIAPHTVSTEFTLKTAKWAGESAPYTYNLNIEGLRADQHVDIYNAADLSNEQIRGFALSCITWKSQADGQIVLKCLQKPTVDLPIVLELEEGQEISPYSKVLAENTWDEIMEAGETPGLSKKLWQQAAENKEMMPLDLGDEGVINFQIGGFNVDELADDSGTAEVTWIAKELLKDSKRMNPEPVTNDDGTYQEGTGGIGGWEKCELRPYVSGMKEKLPENIQKHLKIVKKTQPSYNTSGVTETQTTFDDIWIPGFNDILSGGAYATLFPDNASRSKKKVGAESPSWWFLRSASGNRYFHHVNSSGNCSRGIAYDSGGVALAFCTGSKNPTPIGNCTDISAEGGDGTVTLKWTDPVDTEESIWAGTKVVRKEGGYPESAEDGTELVDSTTRDAYKESGYEDSGLTNGTTYYYQLFPYTDKVVTNDPANRAEATPKGFGDMTWEEIDAAVTDGSYKTRFKLHDTKDLVLGGDYAETIPVEVGGIDHDDLTDGGKAGLTFIAKVLLKDSQMMNSTNTNSGGWEQCDLRTLLNEAILEAFPADLKPLVQSVKKVSDGGRDNPQEVTTDDKVWIPSYHEVIEYESEYVIGQQGTRYPIFTGSISRKYHDKGDSIYTWWLRSIRTKYNNEFCYIDPAGSYGGQGAVRSDGILLCFCLGKSPS